MEKYLFTLLTVCLVSGIAAYLAEHTAAAKHIRYLSALAVMLIIISPLPHILDGTLTFPDLQVPEAEGSTKEYEERLLRETEKRLTLNYQNLIQNKLSLLENDFSLSFVLQINCEHEISFESITVTLKSVKAVRKREAIRDLLSELSYNIGFLEALE